MENCYNCFEKHPTKEKKAYSHKSLGIECIQYFHDKGFHRLVNIGKMVILLEHGSIIKTFTSRNMII